MKVTNLEVSKKLQEIGFKAETEFGYCAKKQLDYPINSDSKSHIKAYDLETILKALPKEIFHKRCTGTFKYSMSSQLLYYDGFKHDDIFVTQKDESLANTAARLLILLHEKGLIQFDE